MSSSPVRFSFGSIPDEGLCEDFSPPRKQKKICIHTILKIHSVAIKIKIKDCVKIRETKKM